MAEGHWPTSSVFPQVGSFGTGTALKGTAEVELVAFLSCFCNFWEEAKYHTAVLRLIRKKIQYCQELLALGLRDLRIDEGVPSALVFTIQTRTAEPITVTLVPAYRVLGKGLTYTCLHTCHPRETCLPFLAACHQRLHSFILHRPWDDRDLGWHCAPWSSQTPTSESKKVLKESQLWTNGDAYLEENRVCWVPLRECAQRGALCRKHFLKEIRCQRE